MFAPLSFDQNNPILTGSQRMADLIHSGLMNNRASMQNAVMPQSLQQQLESGRLANALSQNTLNYAPRTSETNLASTQANTDLTRATIPYVGWNAAAKLFTAQNGQSNAFRAWSQTPEGQKIVSENPQVAEAVFNAIQRSAGLGGFGFSGGAPAPQPGGNPQGMPVPGSGPVPAGASSPPGNQPAPMNAPQGTPTGAPAPSNAVQTIQGAAADAYSKKIDTNQVRNQRTYARVLDNLFESADPLLPSVSEYAGTGGHIKLFKDKGLSSFGLEPKEYKDYNNFTKNQAPLIANEMRRVLGGQATDHEQRLMASIANPATWDSNPELALNQYKELKNIFKNHVNRGLVESPSQAKKGLEQGVNAPASQQQASNIPPPPAGTVNVMDPEGGYHNVPKMNLKEAIKRGYKEVK